MAEVKISSLPITTTLSANDRVVVLANPSSYANVKTIAFSDLSNNFNVSNNVPATSSSNGVPGQMRFSSSYLYICVANNSWKRTSLQTF